MTRPAPARLRPHLEPRYDAARRSEPRGPLVVALIGAAIGAFIGAVGFGMQASFSSGGGAADGWSTALGGGWMAMPMALWTAFGALSGFLLVGLGIRNRTAVLAMRLAGRGLRLAIAGALGLGFGIIAFLAFHGASGEPGDPMAQMRDAAAHPAPGPALMFLLAGAGAGVLAGLLWVGRRSLGRGFRLLGGALVGGMAGLFTYCVGFVLAHTPDLAPPEFALAMARAATSWAVSEFLFVAIAAFVGAFLSKYSWQLYGVLTFIALLFVVVGYTFYTLGATIPGVPAGQRWLSWLLFAAEGISLLMVLLYSFYTIDVAARKHWRRRPADALFSSYYLPKVAFHVPCYNEPADLVIDTLRTLVEMDYPQDRFMVMVCDDSTKAESSGPLEAWCRENGVHYMHRADRRGYKAGALNDLLKVTPPEVNLLAVVDADYQIQPEFLRETAGFFVDPDLGWLQTPQDYRNRHESFLTEQYYLADSYFYRTILPSRNEENSIIFCGTMGILRRRAILEAGGWGEKYITEDAELSVRLLNTGWKSLYVNKTYGRGLIPATFEGYRKQHYRWAFGGGGILRGHGLRLLFGKFTFRQRLDYMVGTMNWFEGLFVFTIALALLAMGIGEIAGNPLATHHRGEVLLVGLVPVFLMADGLTRIHLVMRRTIRLGLGGTLRILGMWFSVKFSDMRAALKALIGFRMPFVRTAKVADVRLSRIASVGHAFRLTRFESAMSLLLAATALGLALRTAIDPVGGTALVGRMLLGLWLVFYSLAFMAAPLYAYKSTVTRHPQARLGKTRRQESPT